MIIASFLDPVNMVVFNDNYLVSCMCLTFFFSEAFLYSNRQFVFLTLFVSPVLPPFYFKFSPNETLNLIQ